MTRVLVFGTFDRLHDGHRAFLAAAAALGDTLIVVASRDSYIRIVKQRAPRVTAAERQRTLREQPGVREVLWGDEWPAREPYRLLRDVPFSILALGYDQAPSDEIVRAQLAAYGKSDVRVVRLPAYRPASLKSSLL